MADKNDITGASLVTKPTTEEFKKGYDSIVWVLGEPATQVPLDDEDTMTPHCCGCCGDEC